MNKASPAAAAVNSPDNSPKRSRNAGRTKLRILHNAELLFTQQPYDVVTLRQIASMSGINVALVARYFGSKKDLFNAVLDNIASKKEHLSLENKHSDLIKKMINTIVSGEKHNQDSILDILMLSSQSREAIPILQERMKKFLLSVQDTDNSYKESLCYITISCILGTLMMNRIFPHSIQHNVTREELQKILEEVQNHLTLMS